MSRHVGKPTICICENKDADQLRGNREADQRLCFRYLDSTYFLYFLNPKFQASSLLLCLHSPVCVRPVRKPHCWFSHEGLKCPLTSGKHACPCNVYPLIPHFYIAKLGYEGVYLFSLSQLLKKLYITWACFRKMNRRGVPVGVSLFIYMCI